MHGMNATEPTPVDTFRVLNYLLKRKSQLNPLVNGQHMKNIEEAFGPEVTEEAMRLYGEDVAAEKGTYSAEKT